MKCRDLAGTGAGRRRHTELRRYVEAAPLATASIPTAAARARTTAGSRGICDPIQMQQNLTLSVFNGGKSVPAGG
jgi:hypothetical protein